MTFCFLLLLSDLNRTIAQSGPDNELTKEEFNEALWRSGKDAAHGPDRIWYLDIKNLTEGDKAELYTIYQKSSDKGYIPKDWTVSCDLFPNQRKTTTQMDTTFLQCKTPLGTSWNTLLPGNSPETSSTGRYSLQIMKRQMGKCSCICKWSVWRISEEKTNSGCGIQSQLYLQQSPVQAADEPVYAIWNQPTTDPVDCSSSPGKNSGYAAWKLKLCSSSAHNGPTTRITTLASPFQCIHQRPGRSEPKWTQQDSQTMMMSSYTKHQGTPRGQPKQCNNNWIVNSCGVMTMDRSSIQTRHKHCGALLTTGQQANQCQQSHLMELWSNKQAIWATLGYTLTECWPTENIWKQQHWSARSVSPEGYGYATSSYCIKV